MNGWIGIGLNCKYNWIVFVSGYLELWICYIFLLMLLLPLFVDPQGNGEDKGNNKYGTFIISILLQNRTCIFQL